jgi:hypothetical protein
MAEPKTQPTTASVTAFLDQIADPARRKDCKAVARLMRKVTGSRPVLWGANIVGFGSYRYTYASGRSGEWPLTGFSPRAADLTLYVMSGFAGEAALLKRLGPHKTGKSCLYLKSLADVDLVALEKLLVKSVAAMKQKHPA